MAAPRSWLRVVAGAIGIAQGSVLAGAAAYGLVYIIHLGPQAGVAAIVLLPAAIVACVPVVLLSLGLVVASAGLAAHRPGAGGYAALWVFHLTVGVTAFIASLVLDHEVIGIVWVTASLAALATTGLGLGGSTPRPSALRANSRPGPPSPRGGGPDRGRPRRS